MAVPTLQIPQRVLSRTGFGQFPPQHVNRDIGPFRAGLTEDLKMQRAGRARSNGQNNTRLELIGVRFIHTVQYALINKAINVLGQRGG